MNMEHSQPNLEGQKDILEEAEHTEEPETAMVT
jgi:hypothetical protein